jgi:hypothetical protein
VLLAVAGMLAAGFYLAKMPASELWERGSIALGTILLCLGVIRERADGRSLGGTLYEVIRFGSFCRW